MVAALALAAAARRRRRARKRARGETGAGTDRSRRSRRRVRARFSRVPPGPRRVPDRGAPRATRWWRARRRPHPVDGCRRACSRDGGGDRRRVRVPTRVRAARRGARAGGGRGGGGCGRPSEGQTRKSTETTIPRPRDPRVCMHVVVNAAQSVDGKLATRRREQLRIRDRRISTESTASGRPRTRC